MGQPWSRSPAADQTCPNCGAVFQVLIERIPHKDRESFDCTECGTEVDEWNTTELRFYTLKHPGKQSPSVT